MRSDHQEDHQKRSGFLIRLAGKVIRIEPQHEEIRPYYQDYLVADLSSDCGQPGVDFTVRIQKDDILFEKNKSAEVGEAGLTACDYSETYLETLAVYRKIAEKMPDYGTILFHGSAVAVDGQVYLFTAKSGTGKSTHTAFWRKQFGDRAVMVNDDKPLITVTGEQAVVHGTPYNGKHRLGENISLPLKAVCILTRAEQNWIMPVSKEEAYTIFLKQVYRPSDREALKKTLTCIDCLMEKTRIYRLGCNMDPEAAQVAYTGMNESMGGLQKDETESSF